MSRVIKVIDATDISAGGTEQSDYINVENYENNTVMVNSTVNGYANISSSPDGSNFFDNSYSLSFLADEPAILKIPDDISALQVTVHNTSLSAGTITVWVISK